MPQTKYSVGTTSQQIVRPDAKRKSVVIQNEDAAKTVRISDSQGDVDGGTGVTLFPYGSVTYSKEHGDDPAKPRFVIASAASASVQVAEE